MTDIAADLDRPLDPTWRQAAVPVAGLTSRETPRNPR